LRHDAQIPKGGRHQLNLLPRMSARTKLTLVNDVHSRLNATMLEVVRPADAGELIAAVKSAGNRGIPIIPSGSRHAMGGQQFCSRGLMLDTRGLNRVLGFDADCGFLEVEVGIEWPEAIAFLQQSPWSIVQKQTGADRLTVGGAVSANIHGRGLNLRPFVQDLESLTLVNARGELVRCSREENAELFRHIVGGYGLFGCIYSVTLRLMPRTLLRRRVRIVRAEQVVEELHSRVPAGALYGDWQFAIDSTSDDFLDIGVCSTYERDESGGSLPGGQRQLSEADWCRLLHLAHTDKSAAFDEYSRYYLSTDGQRYWSDTHQLGAYVDGYHDAIDAALGCRGSEMISEYERDTETALAWARERWACVVFNLHVDHTPAEIARAASAFRGLVDCALNLSGSYYLTYHHWATHEQALAAHPALPGFLAYKRNVDPAEVFQSDWYRHFAAA
jgi:FAD/FMN-containing dehydrogenase